MGATQLPPGTPLWIVIAFVVVSFALTVSERLTKFSGPMGTLARWWQNRQVREIERESAVQRTINSAVAEQVEQRTAPLKVEMDEMKKTIKSLSERLEQAETERRQERAAHRAETKHLTDWIASATGWWHRTKIWLANQGIKVPEDMPEFVDYSPSK